MNTSKSPLVIPFAFPGIDNVGCHFGTRVGGYSADPFYQSNVSFDQGDDEKRVLANRDSLMKSIGFAHWQEVRQIHGTDIVFDPEPAGASARGAVAADGLATTRPGQALIIKTADCQPILVAHKGGRHVLALHVGWRGNVAGFPTTGVAAFCERYNLDPADCSAVRGPSLCPAHSEFTNFDAEFGPAFADYYDPERRTVDLWSLTRDQLKAAGLKERNIFALDLCTYSLVDHFFCYRKHKKTGRQASLIWIRGQEEERRSRKRKGGKGMPTVSVFFGIVISMYFREHNPPHFHAEYGEYEATIDIRTLEILEGRLPRRGLALVLEWASEHRAELQDNWELCQRKELPNPIEPLEQP